MKKEFTSGSSRVTEDLAAKIGNRLKGGEIIELLSDVGGGKTTFVRGLAKGAKSIDGVSSPTFTISNQYRTPIFTIFHYDFYRLNEPGLMQHELAEALGQPDTVCIIEWSEIVSHVLPETRLRIEFVAVGEEERKIIFSCPDEIKYLIEDIK